MNPVSKCPHCNTDIVWLPYEKRKIPIEPKQHPDGTLIIDGSKLYKAHASDTARYRSHLTVCKKLRDALYKPRHIKLPKEVALECERKDCEVDTPHFHCFKCGEIGHYADVCDFDPADLKELGL